MRQLQGDNSNYFGDNSNFLATTPNGDNSKGDNSNIPIGFRGLHELGKKVLIIPKSKRLKLQSYFINLKVESAKVSFPLSF